MSFLVLILMSLVPKEPACFGKFVWSLNWLQYVKRSCNHEILDVACRLRAAIDPTFGLQSLQPDRFSVLDLIMIKELQATSVSNAAPVENTKDL